MTASFICAYIHLSNDKVCNDNILGSDTQDDLARQLVGFLYTFRFKESRNGTAMGNDS